jgi:protein involved in polysaccharide export with SLBB domain
MKKILNKTLFIIGIIGITNLFGASSLENAMLIEQLKKDKSLQADLKAEQQKMGASASSVATPVPEIKIVPVEPVVKEPIAKNEDIEKKAIDVKPSKVYNADNYYKNFTPFYYEDQISLVDEIEKRQTFIKTDTVLIKFGAKFFEYSSSELKTSGVPDDYILATGDSIKISVYGLSEYEGEVVVNNDGKIVIPQIGALTIRGLKYKDAKSTIYNKLKATYPNTTINIAIGNTSPFSVSVVGEVAKPGLYTVNALSKVKDALSRAGGVSNIGSMRDIQVKRNGKVVATFDLYDLLRGGKDNGDVYLYPNDIIFVPAAKKTVYLDGNVKSPAVYELKNNETLKDLLDISGGLNSDTSKTVKIFRSENGTRTLFEAKQNEKIALHDGDKIVVGKISDVTDNIVYLYGNIYKNDSISIVKNDTVGSLFKRLIDFYGNQKVFMANTDMNYFLVKRVDKDTLEPKILSGNLLSAINGDKILDVKLQSEDKIFIFNQSLTQDIKYISINGEVLRDGKFKYFNGMKLIDALMASGTKNESDLNKIKVVSIKPDNSYDIKYYDKENANSVLLKPYDSITISNFMTDDVPKISLHGEVINEGTFNYTDGLTLNDAINYLGGGLKQNADKEYFELVTYKLEGSIKKPSMRILDLNKSLDMKLVLNPFDEITIRKVSKFNDIRTITLKGAVQNSGTFNYSEGLTLSYVLNNLGGGLKQNAEKEYFELVSYYIENGTRKNKVMVKNLNDALNGEMIINPFDEITIRQISQWNEPKTITIKGEVKYPGTYTILPGEKLSSVLKRAGGYTAEAFIKGAVFTRVDIQKIQQEGFKKQLDDLESSMLYLSTQPDEAGKTAGSTDALQVIDSVKKRAADTVMLGRLSIKLPQDIENFSKSEYDVILKAGDTLTIPEVEQSVAIMGEVMNPTAVTYVEKNDLWDFIDQAGGIKNSGDDAGIFVIKANGESQRVSKYFLLGTFAPSIETGDTIIVPYKINQFSGLKFVKDITSIIYQIAVSAAALKTVGAY